MLLPGLAGRAPRGERSRVFGHRDDGHGGSSAGSRWRTVAGADCEHHLRFGPKPGMLRCIELFSLSVLQWDNSPRVRDGYASLSTPGHVRSLLTRREQPVCRTNAPANDRACTPVPSQNLHGKEGVDGSSPTEGFLIKAPKNGLCCCLG